MGNQKKEQSRVNNAVWAACDTLRGKNIAPDDQRKLILAMLFLKHISDCADQSDLLDEIMPEQCWILPSVQLLDEKGKVLDDFEANYYELYKRRHQPGNGERIDKVLRAIEDANGDKFRDSGRSVFQGVSFKAAEAGDEKNRNAALRELMEAFSVNELYLGRTREGIIDIVGNACQFLIANFASAEGRKGGQYFTHPSVSELLAELLDPKPGESICDPACGTASLLIRCARRITKKYDSRNYSLYGQEADGSTLTMAKMNLLLNHEDKHRIEWGDTIRNPKLLNKDGQLLKFDVVTANIPFGLDRWGHEEAQDDKFGRFERGIPSRTKSEYAFILHMIETLKSASKDSAGGRMGVVVPHGVFFRGSNEGSIRKKLIEENKLDAVIGLPSKLLYGTSVPAAILIFKANKVDNNVLFIDASQEFKSAKNQNILVTESIEKITDTYRARKTVDMYAYVATFEEIEKNDFNLSIPRYVDTFEEEEKLDVNEIIPKRKLLQTELDVVEADMNKCLEKLGFDL